MRFHFLDRRINPIDTGFSSSKTLGVTVSSLTGLRFQALVTMNNQALSVFR